MRGTIVLGMLAALLFSNAVYAEGVSGVPLRFIMPLSVGEEMLAQCSRATPPNVTGFWTPSVHDIDKLESELGAALAADPISRSVEFLRKPDLLKFYHRQYIGIRWNTESYIYGNFYPADAGEGEAAKPQRICDGGPAFFGVVYRKATESIVSLAFNGSI